MSGANGTIRWAAGLGFLAVVIGAFGAHSLPALLRELAAEERGYRLAILETGVRYHLAHALALLALGIWQRVEPRAVRPWVIASFLLGIFLFSGSLYVLSLTGMRWLGMITPLGGLAFLGGWLGLACATGPR